MEFVSYASDYDMFKGRRSIAEIPIQEQDELIRLIVSPGGDFREMVVKQDIRKSQAEGLWALIVFIGLYLEDNHVIKNFEIRNEQDIEKIISFFSGTNLWLRLEEAYPPFYFLNSKTKYNWKELETVKIEKLTEATGKSLFEVKSKILEYLSSSPSEIQEDVICRMPYHVFQQSYREGKLKLFVDRGLSPAAVGAGYVNRFGLIVLSFIFFGGLLAFIPLWIFFGFWYALVVLVVSILGKKIFNKILVSRVRKAAIKDKKAYRWLLSRRIIWLQYVWN